MPDPAQSSRIPVVILAGFLGAGKTTFLREILPLLAAGPRPPFVILNDFLNAEVDSASLREFTEEIRAIAAGCVCCDAADGLVEALDAVPADIDPIVLIEANGTTDPYPLLEVITTDPQLAGRFGPVRQVVIINETRWQKRLLPWDRKLERAQLETASHISTNRGHKASVRQQHRVREDIAGHNPHAIRTTPAKLAAEIIDDASPTPPAVGGGTPIGHAHHHAAARIALPIITEDQLRRWLLALPRDILRVKGVATLADGTVRHFQRTDDPDEPPVMMAGALPDEMEPCAILIGPGVDAQHAEHLLESVTRPAVTDTPRQSRA
ncbi:MAG: GTP-binding protein [Luteolibacter sp.]